MKKFSSDHSIFLGKEEARLSAESKNGRGLGILWKENGKNKLQKNGVRALAVVGRGFVTIQQNGILTGNV